MEKIKILRIIARLNIGGPARHTVLLNRGLNKDIFQTILVHGVVDKDEGDMGYLACEKGVRSVIIPELSRRISWRSDLVAFWKLHRLIKKEKPDIIHTHTAKAGTLGRLGGIAYKLFSGSKVAHPKLIHTFHGHVLYGYFGKVKNKIFIWIERFLAKFTDRIIVVNQRIKKELLSFGIGSPEKIAVIPLGLELKGLLALEGIKRETENNFSVGIIGRLVPIKNHKMFLEVVNEFQRANRKLRTDFFIIGDGELREELQKYAKQLGIEENVVFMGWQKELNEVYSNLDIVALASLNEGTPVSLIEAMAAGKAVISSDVGGVNELVNGGESAIGGGYKIGKRGILVKSGDVKGFSEGLRLLLGDSALRKRLGREGKEFVRERFSHERLIKDTENLYRGLAI